jgi:DNA-binding transcriptional ArsR family regulator
MTNGVENLASEIDDDERTSPVGLFNTARSYWHSAEYLSAAALDVTHPQAPVTFLFCHAIELYLKAYLRGMGSTVTQLKKVGHRVSSLAKSAAEIGLNLEPEQSEILSHVDDADVAIEARYIVTGFKNRPTNEALSTVAEHLDRAVCAALIKKGLPLRDGKLSRPDPKQGQDDLGQDTRRVLVRLFEADEVDDRSEAAIAATLAMKQSFVRYHLDRLREANFATLSSSDSEHNYWAIKPEGRRYVVERRLVQL